MTSPGRSFGTSVKGLTGTLTSVERLQDGGLRCNLEIVNQSGGALEIGFDFERSYIADNRGITYTILRTDRGPVSRSFQETLAAGASTAHWIEIPPLTKGALWFLVVLQSHDLNALRFSPIRADLSK